MHTLIRHTQRERIYTYNFVIASFCYFTFHIIFTLSLSIFFFADNQELSPMQPDTNATEPDSPRTWAVSSVVQIPTARERHGEKLKCVAMHESYQARSSTVEAKMDVKCKYNLCGRIAIRCFSYLYIIFFIVLLWVFSLVYYLWWWAATKHNNVRAYNRNEYIRSAICWMCSWEFFASAYAFWCLSARARIGTEQQWGNASRGDIVQPTCGWSEVGRPSRIFALSLLCSVHCAVSIVVGLARLSPSRRSTDTNFPRTRSGIV